MKELNYVHNETRDELQCYWKESYCSIFRLKSAKVEVLSESGREFHNLAAEYEKLLCSIASQIIYRLVRESSSQPLALFHSRLLACSLSHSLASVVYLSLSLIFLAELVRLLLEKGASLEARNKDKATPLDSSHNKQVSNTGYSAPVVIFLPLDFNVDMPIWSWWPGDWNTPRSYCSSQRGTRTGTNILSWAKSKYSLRNYLSQRLFQYCDYCHHKPKVQLFREPVGGTKTHVIHTAVKRLGRRAIYPLPVTSGHFPVSSHKFPRSTSATRASQY